MKGRKLLSKSEIEAIKKLLDEKSHVTNNKKRKKVFSKSEIAEIKKLIDDKSHITFDEQKKPKKKLSKYTVFEYFFEVLGWLKIMASPLFIGIVIGLFIYLPEPNDFRLLIASLIVTIGLIVGIILATRIWKRKGTMYYLSQLMASHDLDRLNEDKEIAEGVEKNKK